MSSAEATPEAEVQGPGQAPEGASSVAHLDMDMGVAAPQPPASVGTCSVVLQLDTALPGKVGTCSVVQQLDTALPGEVGTCSVVLQLDTALPGKARADADARMDADAGGVTMMR